MDTLTMLSAEEREQLLGIWNLIPAQDREKMTQEDVLFVLDTMDDYLESVGLLEVDEQSGDVTYLDGDVDETEQLNYILSAQKDRARNCAHGRPSSPLLRVRPPVLPKDTSRNRNV